jgi:hypothetical protein
MTLPKSAYIYNHQGKGDAFIKALTDGGFRFSGPNSASAIFMDYDIGGRINVFRSRFKSGKARLFIYPHAALPNVGWDALVPRSPYICAVFVGSAGHIEILRRIGIKHLIINAGWSYCERRNFHPVANPKKILFAPIHPTKRGFLSKLDRRINQSAFEKIIKIKGDFEVTVRHIHTLESNGIRRVDGINFVNAETSLCQSAAHVAENDVIIGHHTIACMAVAMGKPTIMMAEDTPPHNGTNESDLKFSEHFGDYKDLLMYPLDILSGDDTIELISRATRSDTEIYDWRNRMIGGAFDSKAVLDTVVSYL